jgi:signal transduction histidine kinase
MTDSAVEFPQPTPTPQRLPKGMQRAVVYLIDDDVLARSMLADMLSHRFDVHHFTRGEDALAALETLWPDVVLLDVVLPGMDGVETCRRMKQRAAERPLPILLIAGNAQPSERLRGAEAGADDFLGKPVNRIELRARVGNAVKLGFFQRQQLEAGTRLQTLQGQLEQAERFATLGTFAAGMGHELNNAAAVLRGIAEELRHLEGVDPEVNEDLAHVTHQLQELGGAAQRLSRPVEAETLIDLRDVVRDVVWLTKVTGRSKYVQVDVLLPAGAVLARLIPVHAQQVLLNLLTNAVDAIGHAPSGKITISLRTEQGQVRLELADNGPGMPAEGAQGSGLGLLVVRQLVTMWRGTLQVESSASGTRVDVTFPFERPSS